MPFCVNVLREDLRHGESVQVTDRMSLISEQAFSYYCLARFFLLEILKLLLKIVPKIANCWKNIPKTFLWNILVKSNRSQIVHDCPILLNW